MRARRTPARRTTPATGRGGPDRLAVTPEQHRTLQRGTRTVVDHVAPAVIEHQRTHLWLDDQAVRVLALTEYPRTVPPSLVFRTCAK
jgi:hypothetical protein